MKKNAYIQKPKRTKTAAECLLKGVSVFYTLYFIHSKIEQYYYYPNTLDI